MEITGYDLRENVAVHVMSDHIERQLGHYAIQAPSLSVHDRLLHPHVAARRIPDPWEIRGQRFESLSIDVHG